MSFRGPRGRGRAPTFSPICGRFSDDPANIPEAAPTAIGTDHSVDPEILAIQGDPEYGEYLSSECVSCHRPTGHCEGIPSITRWPEEDFVVAMHAYKEGCVPIR